jgi:hypothetical protein
MVTLIPAVLAALTLGFLVGLVIFRKAQQWCPECGRSLACPDRHRHESGGAQMRA